jgi:hypothetical protein
MSSRSDVDSVAVLPERTIETLDRERTKPTVEPSPKRSSGPDLTVGVPIEVRSHFHGDWTHGFEIAETTPDGYRLRRLSDRTVLPTEFPAHDIRCSRPH